MHCCTGEWQFALMSVNMFTKCLRDSLIVMLESFCMDGGMCMLLGSSAIGRSAFPNLRRHLS